MQIFKTDEIIPDNYLYIIYLYHNNFLHQYICLAQSIMENYTSDSSDSDSSLSMLDLSHLSLDNEVLDKRFLNTKSPEDVKTLLLGHNRLIIVPISVNRFSSLNALDISSCNLDRLPDFWTNCPLTRLIAKHNNLTNDGLAKCFENLVNLRELNLSGNRLTDFPNQVFDLAVLKYLYLGGNYISEISKDIWKLQR
jgi:Leucine-rich repeat (LRR) protein